ncbi:fatty acid desaturase [Acuticoccus sediminis]|uniref:Fatty acid desaturase n=1 Tax=Acuticoccus sediminis TaxID=2184697 RepID=A0A8B2NSR3_9HYPH|nr:fatty acid desaturase [Acuticoccus sediminis]
MPQVAILPPSSDDRFSDRTAVEWPTVALTAAVYGGWLTLTYFHAAVPALILVPALVWVVAWHSSLQHEIVHGHPTRWRAVNRALGFVPLSLWVPFARYRMLHLAHHRDERLTDPLDDPESYYWAPADWSALSPWARLLVGAQTTLSGRMLIGPAWCISRFIASEMCAIRRGDRVIRRIWIRHGLGAAAVLAWVSVVCGMSPWVYLGIVYAATSLLLVRSFAEHRAEDDVCHRTAIVEKAPVLGLLYLHNNLHAAHHARPTLPWYRLPGWYAQHREALISRNGGLVYRGYGEIARRFLVRRHDMPQHPAGRVPGDPVATGGPAVALQAAAAPER